MIVDNGVGMNFEAVERYWMRITTTNKKDKNVSDVFGRYLTGTKGIGRFYCRRLGAKLTLITKGTEKAKSIGKQNDIPYRLRYNPARSSHGILSASWTQRFFLSDFCENGVSNPAITN